MKQFRPVRKSLVRSDNGAGLFISVGNEPEEQITFFPAYGGISCAGLPLSDATSVCPKWSPFFQTNLLSQFGIKFDNILLIPKLFQTGSLLNDHFWLSLSRPFTPTSEHTFYPSNNTHIIYVLNMH